MLSIETVCMVNVGDPAPTVTLWKTNPEGNPEKSFELSAAYAEGTSVLYFFPAAFTGVCTESSCELRNDKKEFADLDAKLFGLSTDMPFSQAKFMQSNDINYPLLSDYNQEAITAFDIVDNDFVGFKGVSKRSLFAVKDGKIIFKWVADAPSNYPPFDELKAALKSA